MIVHVLPSPRIALFVLSLPLAYIIARYEFRGKLLLQTGATLPLVIPPFVGAVALQLILGRSGMVNLLLMRWFDTTIPFMEGLTGVVLVQRPWQAVQSRDATITWRCPCTPAVARSGCCWWAGRTGS